MNRQAILDGWGQIELYLGCTRKAVLRRGYCIRRHITGRVYAHKEELDAVDAQKLPQTPMSKDAQAG